MEDYGVTYKKVKGCLQAVVGNILVTTPPIPPLSEFINGDVTDWRKQKWDRSRAYPTEEAIASMKPGEQDALRAREATRLLDGGGAWLMLAGKPFYLTPDHYFFLTHFQLPELEHPTFYEADAKDYLWNVGVEQDLYCIGGVFMGARQRGKTARRAARKLRLAMTSPGKMLGIQSKTEDAARDVLNRFISHALRNMSDLIRPITNLATDDAQTKIEFKEPARRGKAAQNAPRLRALNSLIVRKNSKATAFDGVTLYELLSDEWAKKQDYDTEERLTVVSRMMWARDGRRKGRIWMYSTIDEKEDFEVEMPRRVWEGSNTLQRLPNGRTKTGIVSLFMSCLEASVVDEFGRNDIPASLKLWEENAPDKETDPIGYRRYCRANPRTPEDGFASGNKDSTFNLDALDDARDNNTSYFNQTGKYYWQTCNLVPDETDPEGLRRKIVPTKSGRFQIVREAMPTDLNAFSVKGTHTSILGTFPLVEPLNEARNVVGCDPYNARRVRDLGAASRAAAYCFWKPDELHEREKLIPGTNVERPGYWPSDSFFIQYLIRPATPQIFFEDMISLCLITGAPILIENNKDALLAHFEDRGMAPFMAMNTSIVASINAKIDQKQRKTKKGETFGVAASANAQGGTTDQWAERISAYTHGPLILDPRRMPFNEQIGSIVTLNLADTKKYDAAVATGWTMLLARRFRKVNPPPPPRESYRLSEHFNL